MNTESNLKSTPFLDVGTLVPQLGRGKPFRPVGKLLNQFLAVDQLRVIYESSKSMESTPLKFAEEMLSMLGISFIPDSETIEKLKKIEGPLIFASNHPQGFIEALGLVSLMARCRPDTKILGNYFLENVPELRPILISVNPFGSTGAHSFNRAPLKHAIRHLQEGGSLGIFPSGEIASLASWRSNQIIESKWSSHLGVLVKKTSATVVPVYFEAKNSLFFHYFSLLLPKLRMILLPRETLRFKSQLKIRVGTPITRDQSSAFSNAGLLTEFLQLKTESLASVKKESKTSALAPIKAQESKLEIENEIASLRQMGKRILTHSPYELFFFDSKDGPFLMREIGRLREVTFRQVGEGTGRDRDLDNFDSYYSHLLAWDSVHREIVGAYRLGFVDRILQQRGVTGLYTHTLFQLSSEFLTQHQNAIELGRSFVSPAYQREFLPLHLIWQGLGKVLAMNPKYRGVFGPVSISPDFPTITQKLLVRFLKDNRSAGSKSDIVKPRTPLSVGLSSPLEISNFGELQKLIQNMVDPEFQVPPLLKHYFRLGGTILGFNVDPKFRNTIDCLFFLDLDNADPKILKRYLSSNPN